MIDDSPEPVLSFVVPTHDEEDNVAPLHAEITRVARGLGLPYEIVFVNDGSRDQTLERLTELLAADPYLRVVDLDDNFGESGALSAGFAEARGRFVLTLDADGQNDPRNFVSMLAALDDRYDVVSGWRRDREESFWPRVLPSLLANTLIRWVTRVRVHDTGCALKAYRREAVSGARLPPGMHRFLPAVLGVDPRRVTEVPVTDRPRTSGSSHYGLSRTLTVVRDLVGLPLVLRRPRAGRRTARALAIIATAAFARAVAALAGGAVAAAGLLATFGAGALAARHVVAEFANADAQGVVRVRRVLHGATSDRHRRPRLLGPDAPTDVRQSALRPNQRAV
jgi:glycosyltransferase involved in cell wall biosynthesis